MPNEEVFMQAAETAIKDIQRRADEAEVAAAQAKVDAASVARSARRWKILTVLLLILVGVSGWLWFQQYQATGQLRQQAVNSCKIGNERAQGTVTALDELVILLEGPHPTAAVQKEAADYEKFVLSHNSTRDCQSAYRAAG